MAQELDTTTSTNSADPGNGAFALMLRALLANNGGQQQLEPDVVTPPTSASLFDSATSTIHQQLLMMQALQQLINCATTPTFTQASQASQPVTDEHTRQPCTSTTTAVDLRVISNCRSQSCDSPAAAALTISSTQQPEYADNNRLLKAALSSSPSVPLGRSVNTLSLNRKTSAGFSTVNTLKRKSATSLTAPKLSRHNDAAYYPNIQCVLCQEWVCSRNRYMHIESHLQYRPYACSACGYDNRKEIFINLHIKKVHGGTATVIYAPDTELEQRAWTLAEQCLQHTRNILVGDATGAASGTGADTAAQHVPTTTTDSGGGAETAVTSTCISDENLKIDMTLIQPYTSVYRPKIHNSQRIEKSTVIEESRQNGHVPDFTEIKQREIQCKLCNVFILGHQSQIEEHCRQHVSAPTYRCNIDDCATEHTSKNFLTRHMKEVHKYRRPPVDLLDTNVELMAEYRHQCIGAFPQLFSGDQTGLRPMKTVAMRTKQEPPAAAFVEDDDDDHVNIKPLALVRTKPQTQMSMLKHQLSLPAKLSDLGNEEPPIASDFLLPTTSLQSLLAQFGQQQQSQSRSTGGGGLSRQALLQQQQSLTNQHAGNTTAHALSAATTVQCALCSAWLNRDNTALYAHVRTHLQAIMPTANQGHQDHELPYAHKCNLFLVACFPHVPLTPIL